MGKTRAAVVLFVDVDDDIVKDPHDLATFVKQGLYQAGYHKNGAPILVKFQKNLVEVRVVDVMDVGMAAGNGYLWTETTSKAYTQQGIYTEKQQKQLDAEAEWEKRVT